MKSILIYVYESQEAVRVLSGGDAEHYIAKKVTRKLSLSS